ncbi:nitrogenase component 1 [Rubrobacter aplysinae]|uniref:nitrogenase component 1 n=1 Tax=Rubrobacter aplysinae TaxID=909625 RepID=UPI00064C1937|nr:nitrogenase component 1 [Rubrobacter aplysinae]
MTILNESGVPDALSPLYGVGSLCERLPYALVAVAGTRAEAHLIQTLSELGPGAPRLPEGSRGVQEPVYLVLDPASNTPGVEQGQLATRVIGAASSLASSGTGLVLLLVSRSARLLGVDADFEARLAGRRLGVPVLTVDLAPEEDGAGGSPPLSTELEDRALAALVGLCPGEEQALEEASSQEKRGGLFGGRRRGRQPIREGEAPPRQSRHRRSATLMSLQAAPGRGGRSLRELSADMERAGVPLNGSVPAPTVEELPVLGEGSIIAPMDPYLTLSAEAAAARGAEVVETMLPIGVDGTARFIQDIAEATGAEIGAGETSRARSVWERLGGLRGRIRGKRFFLTGDTGIEIPLARFLADAGAVVTEVGTPRLDRRFLAAELQSLTGRGVDVVESPEWSTQLDRVDAAKPDVVIASPGLYVPLVARGYLCRSSLDFLGAGIHGYEGARRILELLVRTMDRAENLDAVEF